MKLFITALGAALLLVLLVLGGSTDAQWTSECPDADLTGRMFAVSKRTTVEGVVKCRFEGRVANPCPLSAPDGGVLIDWNDKRRDAAVCFYARPYSGALPMAVHE